MTSIEVIASSAVSALGSGVEAFSVGDVSASAPSAIALDRVFAAAGFSRPIAARISARHGFELALDPARGMLERCAAELALRLDRALPHWRTRRVGVVVGTSSGGMNALQAVLAARSAGRGLDARQCEQAPYFGPLLNLPRILSCDPELVVQVLAACASSTMALGLACRWLEAGYVDLAIAGGYDALSEFVASGFEALRATTATRPAPFRAARDGMALGEGAALLALALPGEVERGFGFITGFGASNDAHHVTAPDPQGRGLLSAAQSALLDSGLSVAQVGLLSAHATATPFNDAAECKVIQGLFAEHARSLVVHPFKASAGHALGAAGALETLAALDALGRGVAPAAAGSGPLDPAFSARLLEQNGELSTGHALKLSAAFGGANAALVLSREASERGHMQRPPRPVYLEAIGRAVEQPNTALAGLECRLPRATLERLDELSALTLASAVTLLREVPGADRAPAGRIGVVVGTVSATLEHNERFDARRRSRGPQAVEPRLFPATSPSLCAAYCALAWGFRGPTLSVGAGAGAGAEALLVAHDLVALGDADQVIVIAAESVGPVVRDVWSTLGWAEPRSGAQALLVAGEARLCRAPVERSRIVAAVRSSRTNMDFKGFGELAEAAEGSVRPGGVRP